MVEPQHEPRDHVAPDLHRVRRRVVRVIVSTVLTLAVVSGMGVSYLYRHLNGNLRQEDIADRIIGPRPTVPEDVGPHGPINILVMATDSRACEGCAIDGVPGGDGADTTILLHLSGDRKTAYGVSIPRDSLVDRPACRDKDDPSVIHPAQSRVMWNAAFAIGGAACTQAQFEHDTGIRVDHYVTVNFASFKNMVDAIDGVEVCVPEDMHSEQYGIFIRAGTRKISGKAALAYVRVRYHVGDGSDIGRVKRQQAFIGAMVSQVLSADTLANPLRVTRFLNAATKSLTLDMDLTDLVKLALQFKDVGAGGIKFITVPWETPAWDRLRVVWSPAATTVWSRLLHDRSLPASLEKDQAVISVDRLPGGTPSPSGAPSSGSTPPGAGEPGADPSTPAAEANGRTVEENRALRAAGLCT
jgi:LCP family protein required for cell wall assembly